MGGEGGSWLGSGMDFDHSPRCSWRLGGAKAEGADDI
jgi:hypothetical protein